MRPMIRSFGLQRHGHQRANALPDNADPFAQSLIQQRVAYQNRHVRIQHPVPHGRADAEGIAFSGAHDELAIGFQRHHHAALGAHGFDRKVQDNAKQLRQRALGGEFVAGS